MPGRLLRARRVRPPRPRLHLRGARARAVIVAHAPGGGLTPSRPAPPRPASTQSGWSGAACQRLTFFAGRSDPALDDADADETEAIILDVGTESSPKELRLLSFLDTLRSAVAGAERRAAADKLDLAAKQELEQVNATLWQVGGVRRLAEDREDVRRAQLEDLREKYDELSIKAVERHRTQVAEDTVQDVIRRSIVDANTRGPLKDLGEFKVFKPTVPAPDMEDDTTPAADIVRDVDVGEPYDHEVVRIGGTSKRLEKHGSFTLPPITSR